MCIIFVPLVLKKSETKLPMCSFLLNFCTVPRQQKILNFFQRVMLVNGLRKNSKFAKEKISRIDKIKRFFCSPEHLHENT